MARIALMASIIAFCTVAWLAVPASSQDSQQDPCASPDERGDTEFWTFNSWEAFNARDHRAAIANVDACIENWAGEARNRQDQLSADCPPVGRITDPSIIDANAVLNDVATNYWIKGRSYEELGNAREERQAFAACQELRCARTRTRDLRSVWDTSQACAGRLRSPN